MAIFTKGPLILKSSVSITIFDKLKISEVSKFSLIILTLPLFKCMALAFN